MIFYQQRDFAWGWEAYHYINMHAIDYLPPEMSFFQDYKEYLRSHAIDPDTDSQPEYYHYIDIDFYPEFFEGSFPMDWDSIVVQYGYDVLIDYGTVPCVIEQWTDSLSNLVAERQWGAVWQVSAKVGHYGADSYQPLHLTLNYNRQSSGNYGIFSRSETQMINDHLSELPQPNISSLY